MFRLVVMALIFAAEAPALAAPAPIVLNAEGHRIQYSTELWKNGTVLIHGVVDKYEPFGLRVDRNGYVDGEFGGRDVHFRAARETRDQLYESVSLSERIADTKINH